MKRVATLVLGLAIASPILAVGYVSVGSTSGGETSDVSCGAIRGTLGILSGWTEVKTTKKIRSLDGVCGALWDGERYELCSALPEPVTEDSWCQHEYTYAGGKTKVSIDLTAEMTASGTATRQNATDPSWFWVPTVQIHDAVPTVVLVHQDGTTTQLEEWSEITNAYDHIAAHGTGGSQNPAPGQTLAAGYSPDTGGNTSGQFVARTALIGGPQWKFIRIQYHVYSSANRASDNARVNDWKVALTSTMETSVAP